MVYYKKSILEGYLVKNIAKKIMIFSLLGMMQVEIGIAILETSSRDDA